MQCNKFPIFQLPHCAICNKTSASKPALGLYTIFFAYYRRFNVQKW